MPRVQLRTYVDPGGAEVFINVKRRDGQYHRLAAMVDTGAAVSLLPESLRLVLDHRLSEQGTIVIEQAGIAGHTFEVTEAIVTLFLEDQTGARTPEFETRVWFADTNAVLLGFADILDRAILFLDMVNRRNGWIDVDV